MHKTSLIIDDRKVRQARKILGTRSIRDTIDRALDEIVASDARARTIERLRRMEGLDLADPEVRRAAWR